MKERPILFSGEMVRSILDGRKTQTRRVVKYIPVLGEPNDWCYFALHDRTFESKAGDYRRFCPYGQPGDRLWVKETIVRDRVGSDISFYAADDTMTPADAWPWKRDVLSPLFCPRGLSRINLLIKDIRVERVQNITPEDAKKEGDKERSGFIEFFKYGPRCHVHWFRRLWDAINVKKPGRSWDENPWVWVIDFERCE